MERACLVCLLLGVTACSPPGNALKVTLETTAGRAETCFVVEVRDGAGEVRGQTRFPRHDDRTSYLVAIVRDTLPADVKVEARALIGADCQTATRPNGTSESVDVTFDPKRILEVTLHLSGGDDDGDGFVATAHGGEDCNDGDPAISPGAPERCFGAVDHDCNGLVACADPACAGQPCAGPATQLAFSSVPASVRLGACSGAIAVVLEDAQGRLAQAPAGARLTPGGPFTFFSDGACTTPVTDLPLSATTTFALVAAQTGTARLTVDSPMLGGDLRDLRVDAALPAGLQFTSAPVTARAGQCSPGLSVGLVDVNGLPTPADGPVSVSLGTDAGGVFGLYSDGACGQPLSSLDLAAGMTVGTFHFSGQRAGPFGVRAEAVGLTAIEQRQTITPGPVATVVLLAATPTLTAFTCSDAFTVDARDAFGNVVAPGLLAIDVPDAGATVFTAPGCVTNGTSTQFALIASEEGRFTVLVTADGVSASQPITVRRPGPAGSTWRWPLAVTTGARAPAGGYQGYTLLAAFDSREAVDAGSLTPGASELRVHFWSDAGWREVDRLIENPNSANTTVRFASQTDLPSSATDLRYSLFAGPFDGGTGAANPHAVYLFADDFEEGTLARWTLRSGAWQRATDRVHGGVGSLKFGAEGNNDRLIEASPALSESDVMVEAWWNTSNVGTADFSQLVRLQPGVVTAYETNLETTGWDIAWDNAGAWTELVANRGPATVDTWVRIGLSISGRDARVWQNRVQLVPQTGAFQVAMPGLAAGNVGFRKHNLAGSMWIDDVTARRYTEPEPGVSVGEAQRVP